ncbi:MAG: NHLP bacteriocin export ABC transporter permease/ATPase subunit [Lachnospiraceae bacterium]|nr:NHLP bacteriocin export ABC transporter permease/ATPase subunit [Lachnospiraceae bacterium]
MSGWFDEQIKQRKERDKAQFEGAFAQMASAVMGRKVLTAYVDETTLTKSAIEDILKSLHLKPGRVPDKIEDPEEQLEYMLRPHGIMYRRISLSEGWYEDAYGPMLAKRLDDDSAVALLQDPTGKYYFYDTRAQKKRTIDKKTAKLFDKDALCFYRPFPLKSMTMKDLLSYILKTVSQYDQICLILAAAVVTLVGTFMPRFQNLLLSSVLEKGNTTVLMAAGFFFIAFSLSSAMFSMVKTMFLNKIMTKTQFSVEAAVMMRVLSMPADFFHKHGTGELAQRVQYMNTLSESIMEVVYSTGLTALLSLIYIFQIRRFAPALMLPAIVIILVTIAATVILSFLSLNIAKARMEKDAGVSSLSYAIISGLQKIKLAGAEKRAFAKWAGLYSESAALQYDLPWYLKISGTIPTAIGLAGTVVLYWLSIGSGISAADYFAFNSAYGMVMGAFQAMAGIALTIAQIKAVLDMARPIMEAEPEVAEDKEVVENLSGSIELAHVSFRYDEGLPLVVNDMNLKIKSGQYVAIVGRTGCGKSTLMRLLLGFEKPEKGAIYYDGKDIKKLDMKSLRRKIGVVMQNGRLIAGSIFENVSIACPNLTMDEAWEACEKAGIADDIRSMPMGMHTMVSEGSGGISGGQRQRLMIARAIAGKPRLLMFDEATSALDNKTQKQVTEALDALKCTRIVIAHRLSTIRQCDRILLLEGGKVIEDGTYEELMELNGKFAELVERQKV